MVYKEKQNTPLGFTVVELLIVIVVIGILATIVVVSYTGIKQKAVETSLKSDLTNVLTQLKMDQVNDNQYPSTLNNANDGKGVTASPDTTYQYTVDNSANPQAFCVTATKNNLSYKIDQDGDPIIGGCPGDIVLGTPSILNPSFELDTVGNLSYPAEWTKYGMTGNVYEGVSSDFSKYGTKSFKISQASVDMDGGLRTRVTGIKIGQKVTVSAWIKSGSGVANASLVLCTTQNGLTGSQTVDANQADNVNGRFSATIDSIDQTAVDVFIGQGSFGYSSQGDVWFDGIMVVVE